MKTNDIGKPSKWVPIDGMNLGDVAAIGKLGEEVNELGKIIFRIMIQGIDGVDPDTGQKNVEALAEEIADVRGLSRLVIDRMMLDESAIGERGERKRLMKIEWIRMLDNDPERD